MAVRVAIAVQADEDEAGLRVAGGGEDQALLVEAGRVRGGILTGGEGEEGEPGGEQVAGLHTATGGGRIELGDGAGADHVFYSFCQSCTHNHERIVIALVKRCPWNLV